MTVLKEFSPIESNMTVKTGRTVLLHRYPALTGIRGPAVNDSAIPASSDAPWSISLPYLAGFFDGEGSIGIYTNGQGRGRTLRVQITQTVNPQSTMMLTSIRGKWGGSLAAYNKGLRRQAWNWQATATRGYVFLRDIRPWLLIKAEQADVVLNWWPNRVRLPRDARGRNQPQAPEARAADEAAARALRDLKRDKDVDLVMADAADLVEVRHALRQVVNVKGD